MIFRRLIAAGLLLACGAPAMAGELRNYLDTYDYRNLEEGHRELQFWTEFRNPERGDEYFAHQTGVEYGASNHYTVGVFGQFVEGLGFTAARLVNRFRLSEPGAWPVDTAVQLEFKDANGRKDQDKIESMVIVSKDIDQVNLTGNAIMQMNREVKGNGDDEWDLDPALSLAAAIKTPSIVTPGVELYIADDQSRIVPGAYIAVSPDLKINVGAGIGLEDKADDFQLKTLVSLKF